MAQGGTAYYQQMARQYAQAAGVPVNVFLAQIGQESGWNPKAHSGAGADGIAQIVPKWHPGVNTQDPLESLKYAAQMDANNLKKYGSVQAMLSAYNSGRADAYKDPNFAGGQTYNYVKSIMAHAGKTPAQTSAPVPVTAMGSANNVGAPDPNLSVRTALLGDLVNRQKALLTGQQYNGPSLSSVINAAMTTKTPQQATDTLNSGRTLQSSTVSTPTDISRNGAVKILGNAQGVKSSLINSVTQAAAAAGATQIKITSGFRSEEHNRAVGGAEHSNHLTGDALDGYGFVPGKGWVPLGTLVRQNAGKYGLRSGATFNWNGAPDVYHVDDALNQR